MTNILLWCMGISSPTLVEMDISRNWIRSKFIGFENTGLKSLSLAGQRFGSDPKLFFVS